MLGKLRLTHSLTNVFPQCNAIMNHTFLSAPSYAPSNINGLPVPTVGQSVPVSLYRPNPILHGTHELNALQLGAVYRQALETRFVHNFAFSRHSLQYHEDPEQRLAQELCQSIKKEILSQLGTCNKFSTDSESSEDNQTMHMNMGNQDRSRGTKRQQEPQQSPEKKRTKSEGDNGPTLPKSCRALTIHEVNTVTEEIWEYFEHNRQSQDVYCGKMKLHQALNTMIKSVFPYAGLYGVGSSMNGTGSNTSDLDLCLMVSHKQLDQKRDALELLKVLRIAMRKLSFIKDLTLIRAKVPILKFRDSISGCECDLNVNNAVGIRNTHLINAYTKSDWRISPLMLMVKRWARAQDINDASKCTISSFSLVLMLIHYLQVGCRPPVLPNLQQKYPDKFNPRKDIRLLTLNDQIPQMSFGNQMTLGELFIGFLDYYTNVFNFETNGISVRLAQRVSRDFLVRQSNGKEAHGWKFLCIEEPFDLTNTARSVYDPHIFERIKRVIRLSYRQLTLTGNLSSILDHPL